MLQKLIKLIPTPKKMKYAFRPQIKYCFSSNVQTKHNYLNEQYKEYKKTRQSTISQPRLAKDYFINPETNEKQKKLVKKSLDEYLGQYKFDNEFDCQKFIHLLSKISYCYDNDFIIQDKGFRELILQTAENCFLFEKNREFCLFYTFCATHKIDIPDIWQNFSGFLKNYANELDLENKVLILQGISEINSPYLNQFYLMFEDEFLKELQNSNVDLKKMAYILYIYQKQNNGSESFILTFKNFVLKNLEEMKPQQLIDFLMHYANNQNVNLDEKKEIMNTMMIHLFKIIRFLSTKELVQVTFCYIKNGMGNDVFYRLIEDRIFLLMPEMTLKDIEMILIMSSNEDRIKKTSFTTAEAVLTNRVKDIQPQDLVQIMYLFNDSNLGSKDFMKKLEEYLYPSLYSTPIDQLAEIIWSMQLSPQPKWLERAAGVLLTRIGELKVKHLAQIIWLLSDYYKSLEKPEDSKLKQLFEQISIKLMNEFQKSESITIKDCSLVINAYVQNQPISAYLVDLLLAYLVNIPEEEISEKMDAWDLSTIVWGFSYLENYNSEYTEVLFDHFYNTALDKLEEMSPFELLNTLRAYILTSNEKEVLIQNGIDLTLLQIERCTQLEEAYLTLFVFTKTRFQGLTNQEKLIVKILEQIGKLKQITTPTQESDLDRKTREYLVNEEVQKYK